MSYAITLLALLIILAGLSLLAQPRLLMDFMARYRDSHALYAGAVLVRLVFGILLLTFADQSRWPMFLQV